MNPPATAPPGRRARLRARWQALDSLSLRLFLLLWSILVLSTMLGFGAFRAVADAPPGRHDMPGPAASGAARPPGGTPLLALVPSLPPLGRLDDGPGLGSEETGAGAAGGGAHRRGGPPWPALGLDLLMRVAVTGLASWWAARWLSGPMRRLGVAADGLRQRLSARPGAALPDLPLLDTRHGTREVRAAATLFNDMARQLHADFQAQHLLLATVSHDLRTPLARLRLRLAQLETTHPPDPQLARAIDDVQHMDVLIGSLLELVRPAAPPSPADGAPLPVPATEAFSLVQALVDDLEAGDDRPGGSRWQVHGGPLATRCAPSVLRRMVQNLLDNAAHHGHGGRPGSATVDVEVRRHQDGPQAAPWVEIRVLDRGPGLSAQQCAEAGTPFMRWEGHGDPDDPGASEASGAMRQAPGGTMRQGLGLGLHITRLLAERAGGSLRLQPRPGGGLQACLRLPAA